MIRIKQIVLLTMLVLAVCLWCGAVHAAAVSYDRGSADTLVLVVAASPDAATQQYQLRLELYARTDVDTLGGLSIGFSWSNANIRLDSTVATSLATTAFDYGRYYYYKNNRDSTNAHHKFLFAGARIYSGGLPPSTSRQLLARYYFTATSWASTDSVILDTNMFSDGTRLVMSTIGVDKYVPQFVRRTAVYDIPAPTLVSPANGDSLTTLMPDLDWSDVLAADKYEIQIDNDSTFGSPNRTASNLTSSVYRVFPALGTDTWWYWRVRATDDGIGKTSGWSAKRKYKTYLEEEGEKIITDAPLPDAFALYANYPNPFNPTTTIAYDIPTNSHVTITIYNTLGQVVTTLVDREMPPGRYSVEWRGTDATDRPVSSGIYLYRIEAGTFQQSKKMLLVK